MKILQSNQYKYAYQAEEYFKVVNAWENLKRLMSDLSHFSDASLEEGNIETAERAIKGLQQVKGELDEAENSLERTVGALKEQLVKRQVMPV